MAPMAATWVAICTAGRCGQHRQRIYVVNMPALRSGALAAIGAGFVAQAPRLQGRGRRSAGACATGWQARAPALREPAELREQARSHDPTPLREQGRGRLRRPEWLRVDVGY